MFFISLASIIVHVIMPIALVAAVGFILARVLQTDARPLSQVTLYFFSPVLVFVSAYQAKMSSEYASIAAFGILITAITGAITLTTVKIARFDRITAAGFSLGTMLVNSGNYGLPLILFAFGKAGLVYATFYFSITMLLLQTIAVFIAARGRTHTKDAILSVIKMPVLYAVIAGIACNQLNVAVPEPLSKALDVASGAAIPVMLVVLGIQLSGVKIRKDRMAIGLATFIRLVLVPVIAFPLAYLLHLEGVPKAVCIVQASMPTAVFASIVSVEFDVKPEIVTGVISVSTFLSIITLTILLQILH
jgi:malate permease and related proteins